MFWIDQYCYCLHDICQQYDKLHNISYNGCVAFILTCSQVITWPERKSKVNPHLSCTLLFGKLIVITRPKTVSGPQVYLLQVAHPSI